MNTLNQIELEHVSGGFVVHGLSCSANALSSGLAYLAAVGDSGDPGFAELLGVACIAGIVAPATTIHNVIRNGVAAAIGGAVTGSGSRSHPHEIRLRKVH